MSYNEEEARQKVYTLPAPIAAAIQADRGHLAQMLAVEIKKGHTVPPEQVLEMVRFIGDIIDERYRMREELKKLKNERTAAHEKLRHAIGDLQYVQREYCK